MRTPTVTTCKFEEYDLKLTLKLVGVVRTLQYRTVANSPLYNMRYSIDREIEKVSE